MKYKIIPIMLLVALSINCVNIYADNGTDDTNDIIIDDFDSDSSFFPEEEEPKPIIKNITITPIQGSDKYILDDGSAEYVSDLHGAILLSMSFVKIENAVGPKDCIYVWDDRGMGLLNKNLELIVPCEYTGVEFLDIEGQTVIKAVNYDTGFLAYYDLNGEKLNNISSAQSTININNDDCSQWAKESVSGAISAGIVPANLQSKYTDKITRREFCRLAMETYKAVTNNSINATLKSPFSDVDDIYVTNAYSLNIVAGTGNGKFSPDNNITRQEAAVMLNNLAKVLGIKSTDVINKFDDDSAFAVWARQSIYLVAGIKSGDTYVLVGTSNNRFSPWANYTREQSIATLYRLYNCK